MNSKRPVISVVVPFYNEEKCVEPVVRELFGVLEQTKLDFEVVAVDDGSSDRTFEVLSDLAGPIEHLRVLSLPGNCGQGPALFWGLQLSRGEILVTMDGDGQNDPRDIPLLINALDEADLVVGRRMNRRDTWLRRGMSRTANRVRRRILGDGVSDSGCALKAFRREVLSCLIPLKTLYSFVPAMAAAAGFRIQERDVRHRARETGQSSYGLRKFLLWPTIDMVGLLWLRKRRFPRRSYNQLLLDEIPRVPSYEPLK